MEIILKYKTQIIFHLILNVVIGIFISFSSYYHIPLNYLPDYLAYLGHFLILQFTVFGFLYILSLQKHLFYIIFPLIFIINGVFSYFVYLQDITISNSIIQVVLESKLDIAVDFLTTPFILYLFAILFVLTIILKLYSNLQTNPLKSPLLLFSFVGILTFFIVENYKFGTLKRRLPYNLAFGLLNYSTKSELNILPVKNNISSSKSTINIVLILGESVRSDHLQLNGYKRNTTPLLLNNKNIISYPNVFTPLTYTGISLPQILSDLSVNQQQKASVHSIYSILNNLNFNTTWLGNQTPEKSYHSFIKENKHLRLIDQFHSSLSFNKKLDSELIPPFKKAFKNTHNQFITVHMIGSHWWYENRYSNEFRKFKPVVDSKHIPSLSKEQLINSYDNTILYLDNFLTEIILNIEKTSTKTILIYLSDHGEILGENNKWLHAQEHNSSKNPAMIVWCSNEFKSAFPNKVKTLKINSKKFITTDYFFHSILDLVEIQNFEYSKNKSIFNTEMNFRKDSIKFILK